MDYYINIKPNLYRQAIEHIIDKEYHLLATTEKKSYCDVFSEENIKEIAIDIQDDFQEYILFLPIEEQIVFKKFIKHIEIDNENGYNKAVKMIADDVVREIKNICIDIRMRKLGVYLI